MEELPWGVKQLRRLGEAIRDGSTIPNNAPSYEEVELWFSDLAARTQRRISEHDWRVVLGHREFEVSARAKTIDTLRDKLLRDRSTPLPSVQDIAGVRFEADMTLWHQTRVAQTISNMFAQEYEQAVHDLRGNPLSGYRAVHVWLRLPARVEVQVRTRLQSAWANVYEELGDVAGRDIRDGEMPVDPVLRNVVESLQSLSAGTLKQHKYARNLYSGARGNDEARATKLRESEMQLLEGLTRLQASIRSLK